MTKRKTQYWVPTGARCRVRGPHGRLLSVYERPYNEVSANPLVTNRSGSISIVRVRQSNASGWVFGCAGRLSRVLMLTNSVSRQAKPAILRRETFVLQAFQRQCRGRDLVMANVLKMALIESILSLHAQHWSQRRIARELQIDRETVRKYLRERLSGAKPANAPTGSGGSKPATSRLAGSGSKTSHEPADRRGGSSGRGIGRLGRRRRGRSGAGSAEPL